MAAERTEESAEDITAADTAPRPSKEKELDFKIFQDNALRPLKRVGCDLRELTSKDQRK